MKKRFMTAVLTAAMTAAMGMTAFAAQWMSNDTGWWWVYDNGKNPVNEWLWLDGNQDGIYECYYFGSNGYMLANTTTPDGYQVNSDGAWIVNGGVQLKFAKDMTNNSSNSGSASEETQNYLRDNLLGTYTSEKDDYYELMEGAGDSLAAFYYDADGDITVYNFAKVSDTKYRDSSRSRTITFVDENTFSVNDRLYYR